MRVFKTKLFSRWADEEGMTDKALCEAVEEVAAGLVDANLGSNVYKKRVGLNGRGKRGGVRTLIAFRVEDKAFFLYGFAKNERDNITRTKLEVLRLLAKQYLSFNDKALTKTIGAGELIEVTIDEQVS